MTLGEQIDELYQKRAERLELEKQVEELKKDEEAIKNYLLTTFGEEGLNGAKGSVATAAVSVQLIPHATDWPLIYKYIDENKAWDLLERRIGRMAYRSRYEAGEEVPGIEPISVATLSLTKIGKRG